MICFEIQINVFTNISESANWNGFRFSLNIYRKLSWSKDNIVTSISWAKIGSEKEVSSIKRLEFWVGFLKAIVTIKEVKTTLFTDCALPHEPRTFKCSFHWFCKFHLHISHYQILYFFFHFSFLFKQHNKWWKLNGAEGHWHCQV